MAAPTITPAVRSAEDGGTTTIDFGSPEDGDLLVVFSGGNPTTTVTPPSGWTEGLAPTGRLRYFGYRYWSTGDPTTFDFSYSAAWQERGIVAFRASGVADSSPLTVGALFKGWSRSYTAPAITTPVDDCTLVLFINNADSGGTIGGHDPVVGWNEFVSIADSIDPLDDSGGVVSSGRSRVQESAGDTGSVSGTIDHGNDPYTTAFQIAIAPFGGVVNQPPVADAGSPQSVTIPNVVNLDGSGSSDPEDGDVSSYEWEVTDAGATGIALGRGAITNHTSATPSIDTTGLSAGEITVRLTVTDSGSKTASDTVVVTVSEPAPLSRRKMWLDGGWNSMTRKVRHGGSWLALESREIGSGTGSGSGGGSGLLTWEPPDTTGYTVINVPTSGYSTALDENTDYVFNMPAEPVTGTVVLRGGRNIVMIGGEIKMDAEPPWTNGGTSESNTHGIYITRGNNSSVAGTRIIHIEGVLIHGYYLSDGIRTRYPEPPTDVDIRIQNCRIEIGMWYRDSNLDPSGTPHPDVLQPFGGCSHLRVDGFTGLVTGQGLMIKPDYGIVNPGFMEFRRTNLRENTNPNIEYNDPGATYPNPGRDPRYYWWTNGNEGGVRLQKGTVWFDHPIRSFESAADFIFWPKTGLETGTDSTGRWVKPVNGRGLDGSGAGFVYEGVPSGGDYVPDGVAGTSYTSPGYV